MTLIQAIILAIIEGITEFLPVSSTGHMILASAALGIENGPFLKTFEISIQLGAIFAIVFLYVRKFLTSFKIYVTLMIAFVPTAIIGFLAYGFIKSVLFNPVVVAVSLIAGGIILVVIDKKVINQNSKIQDLENMPSQSAFFIGLIQCISMIPGVSRAAATIIGGIFNGLNKKQATEFSFLLAVPTMFAASGYDLYKSASSLNLINLQTLGTGFITAFIFAYIAVLLFLKFVEKYGFKYFGYYRILIGVVFLMWIFFF
jgi:undecaprenyl-diphosphatase